MTFGEAVLAHDVRLSAALRDAVTRRPGLRPLAIPLARSGDAWVWLLGAGVVALLGGPSARRDMLLVVLALVATGLVVKAGKSLTRRARPEGEWGGSYRRQDPHAFPSGHAARSVLLAVLAFAIGPGWLGPLMILWAAAVAVSRVVLGVHYVSDVVAGALLGLACGLAALLVSPIGR